MPNVEISDWGDAVFLSLTNALNSFLNALPQVIGALLILLIGWIIAGILAKVVTTLLARAKADEMFARHGSQVYGQRSQGIKPSVVAGELVKWLVRIVFLVAAANVLGLTQISLLLNEVLLWIPNLIVAVVILLLAPVLARFVRGAIEVGAGQMGFSNAPLLGRIAEVAIVVFAVIIAINQVGIAANLVNTLFIGVVGALALAFGLAFGLGGQQVASQITQEWYRASQESASSIKAKVAASTAGPGGSSASSSGGSSAPPPPPSSAPRT